MEPNTLKILSILIFIAIVTSYIGWFADITLLSIIGYVLSGITIIILIVLAMTTDLKDDRS